MTILISHFLRFGELKNLTGDYFVLRKTKMIYSKQKLDVLFILVFSQHLLQQFFPIHFVQGWRTNGIWIELHISK